MSYLAATRSRHSPPGCHGGGPTSRESWSERVARTDSLCSADVTHSNVTSNLCGILHQLNYLRFTQAVCRLHWNHSTTTEAEGPGRTSHDRTYLNILDWDWLSLIDRRRVRHLVLHILRQGVRGI